MLLGIIGDIHGFLPGLETALGQLRARRVDVIVCLGDIVDGYPENNQVVAALKSDPGIRSLRGNHDEVPVAGLTEASRRWLLDLPEEITVANWTFHHFSPRRRDEKINDGISAWNAFDDADFANAAVGHAHISAVFRYRRGMGSVAEELPFGDGKLRLDPSYRHILVNPSLAYNRDARRAPGYSLIDTDRSTIEFNYLELTPIVI